MDNIPRFLIIGNYDNINKVIDKLPNKYKINNYYLYNIINPFIEYGYNIYKNDNDFHFKIIVCPEEGLTADILNSSYINTLTGLIICCNDKSNIDSYKIFADKISTHENIYIWFDKKYIDYQGKDFHCLFDDNLWQDRLYKYIEYPINSSYNCNIL